MASQGRLLREAPQRDWGDWRLGDLSDAVRRVCDALGPASPAATVTVHPPDAVSALPVVAVLAPDAAAVEKSRSELVEGAYSMRFLTMGNDESDFEAEVSGLVLHVWCLTPREPR